MISTTTRDSKIVLEIVREAAAAFAKNPELATYSRGLTRDEGEDFHSEYIALRWGLMERSVLVLKLDPDFIPINFRDAIGDI